MPQNEVPRSSERETHLLSASIRMAAARWRPRYPDLHPVRRIESQQNSVLRRMEICHEMNGPSIEERMRRLLELAAIEKRPCRACGAMLYFIQHANGKRAPYTDDGLNHFVNCPDAARFKGKEA